MVFKDKFDMYLSKFENYIEKYLDELKKNQVDDNLFESMKYSLTSKGKRIRPIIMMAFYELCGGKSPEILKFALAIEMVHTYSLIHDDLPAMDNDTMRRGKPCNHVKFGEDIALLAGDALLTNAFELISSVNESEIESSKIINLDNKSDSKIIPNLIIDNKDVVANHSAFIGEFSLNEINYLRSRGISLEDAYRLLLKANLLNGMELEIDMYKFIYAIRNYKIGR